MQVNIVDVNNKKIGDIALSDALAEKVNKAVLYYAVKADRASLRRGTACVKDRSDVKMTNKKIYRQKGTGNARHAARSANIFVGGGSAHGPRPRSYVENTSKTFRKVSYREAFKYLVQNQGLSLLNEVSFAKPSTKQAVSLLTKLKVTKTLVILPQENVNAAKSFRNIRDVKVINESNINVYDMLRYGHVVMTADFMGKLKVRYSL